MDNQYETLIPSKLNYITLLSQQTSNTKLRAIIEFNASIRNNTMGYL